MRAANQLLGVADPGTAEDTARWMLALQAQDFAGARWALALRGRSGETVADIHAALDGARIVRSWPLRGTLQITAAEDLRLLLAVSAERTIRATRTRRAQLGLEAEDLMHAEALALRLLADRRPMQRTQLMAAFDADGLDTSGQRGSHLLLHLALTRVVCFGPLEGRQHTVVLLDDWVPGPDPDRSGALRVLAPRYFTSHGPASVGDLAWWAGITTTEAAAATAEAAGGLIPLAGESGELWVGRGSAAVDTVALHVVPGEAVRLLPAFDELLLGYADRSASLAPEHAERVSPGGNGLFRPVLARAGRVLGTWRAVRRRGGFTVTSEPFDPDSPVDADADARAFAAFSAP
jgi:hypothetical protein